MGLTRIREALDAPDRQALRDLLSAHLDELARHMEQLREAMETLEHSVSCQHPNITDCPRAWEVLEDTATVCAGGSGRLRGSVSG
jgi:hypothetical protein